jgi:hypothetical protein
MRGLRAGFQTRPGMGICDAGVRACGRAGMQAGGGR